MIIDEQADFRTLLMHHVTTGWPDAIISAYDPTAAGHLPDEFSGAGNDVILLGNRHGNDRSGVEVLQRFTARRRFPPIVYFGSDDDEKQAARLQPAAQFRRDGIRHDALVDALRRIFRAGDKVTSPNALFMADARRGNRPLIKGYRFLRKLGSSERSGVYLVERESTGLRVVLKVLRQMPEFGDSLDRFDRFLQEYETIAAMDHRNVVRIHDLGVSDDHAHIAMEYLDGGDLRQRIDAGIRDDDAVSYLRQTASALSAVHEQGVLHRDLKPGNIMFRQDESLALIDFGLAKKAHLENAITDTGEIFGTPFYMSPEQGHGLDVDERSDIYSLGVIFFEMLTGERPYQGDSAMGIIVRHAQTPIPRLPESLQKHQALVDRMIAKQPDDRLQAASEIAEWL